MPKLTNLARKFRQEPTLAEKLLWDMLRRKSLSGFKFRRQDPVDAFIVDFICRKEKLIIELDGAYFHGLRKEEDEARTKKLESLGYKVIRFDNEYLINQPDNVIEEIEQILLHPLKLQHPLPVPPPEGGG